MESVDIDVKVVVTVIAAIVSFIGLIIAKDHKISEFRQSWINDFRDGVSELLGCLINIHAHYIIADHAQKDGEEGDEEDDGSLFAVNFIESSQKLFNDAHRIIYKLKLMLNPEKDHELIASISAIEAMILDPEKLDCEQYFHQATDKLYILSHATLKKEWSRVKKGEFVFQSTKYLLATGLVIFIGKYIMENLS